MGSWLVLSLISRRFLYIFVFFLLFSLTTICWVIADIDGYLCFRPFKSSFWHRFKLYASITSLWLRALSLAFVEERSVQISIINWIFNCFDSRCARSSSNICLPELRVLFWLRDNLLAFSKFDRRLWTLRGLGLTKWTHFYSIWVHGSVIISRIQWL